MSVDKAWDKHMQALLQENGQHNLATVCICCWKRHGDWGRHGGRESPATMACGMLQPAHLGTQKLSPLQDFNVRAKHPMRIGVIAGVCRQAGMCRTVPAPVMPCVSLGCKVGHVMLLECIECTSR